MVMGEAGHFRPFFCQGGLDRCAVMEGIERERTISSGFVCHLFSVPLFNLGRYEAINENITPVQTVFFLITANSRGFWD